MGGGCSLNLPHANFLFLECNEKIERRYIRPFKDFKEAKSFLMVKLLNDVKSASKCREICLSTPGCDIMSYYENVSAYDRYSCNLFKIDGSYKKFVAFDIDDMYTNMVIYICSEP